MKKVSLGLLHLSDQLQKITSPGWVKDLIFLLLIVFLIQHLNVFGEMFYYPQGLHVWRQSDGFAQIMNYYQNDLDFWDWGLAFNQFENAGRGVAEFPVHYYLQAVLWKVFGVNYWIPQIYSTVLTVSGLFCFYRATALVVKDVWAGIVIGVLFFFSPLFNAYAFRVMPDAYALATLNMSFYAIVIFIKRQRLSALIVAIILLSLTGMVKIFYMVPYLAFLPVIIWDLCNKKTLHFKWIHLIIYLIPLVLSLWWIKIMRDYNGAADHHYFLMDILPYWNLDREAKNTVWTMIKGEWVYQVFNFFFFRLSLIFGFVSLVFFFFMKEYKWMLFLVLSISGVLAFDVLIYLQLAHHDYYFLTHLFLIIGVWVTFFTGLRVLAPKTFYTKVFLIFTVTSLLFNFTFLKDQFHWRYSSWRNESGSTFRLVEYHDEIQELIPEDALVIVPEDPSPSHALAKIERNGWSGYQLHYNRFTIDQMIAEGAEYVVLYQSDTIPENLQNYTLEDIKVEDHFRIMSISKD